MRGLLLTLLLFISIVTTAQPGHAIRVNVRPYTSGYLFLGHHFGQKQYLVDSARIGSDGFATFSSKDTLPGGIYLVAYPNKDGFFEILVDKQQHFTVLADTSGDVKQKSFQGSTDNDLFLEYLQVAQNKGGSIYALEQQIRNPAPGTDTKVLKQKIAVLQQELNDYRINLMKQHPEHLLAAVFRMMQEPNVPPASAHPGGKYDSTFAYQYYKQHYWDGVSFADDRLLRTPVFEPKFEKYYDQVIIQLPDTIIQDAEKRLTEASNRKEMSRYLLSEYTERYINPKYMGQDAVFLHLFENYYSKGVADWWMTEAYRKFVYDRAYSLMANQLGKPAWDMKMVDTAGKPMNLYSLKNDYIVICFWDATCSHCRDEVPKVDSIFQASWKKKGVTLYGVMTDGGKEAWLKFIREHNLKDWIHVYQTEEQENSERKANQPGFRQLYDVYQTPILYLLDKDKRIVAKKLTYLQLNDVLEKKVVTSH